MFLGFFLLLIICSICFPKSKMLMLLWGLFLIVNVVCTIGSPDVIALEFRYTYKGFNEFPTLFKEMMRVASENDLTFEKFKLLYICTVTMISFATVLMGTNYTAFCMMLLCIYPGWCFSGQIRNTIGVSLVIIAMVYLIRSDSKRKTMIYIIAVIVATFVHPACLAYLLVLPCIKKQRQISIKAIIGYIIVIVFLYSNLIYRVASLFIHNDRILQYLKVSLSSNIFGSIVVILGQIVLTYFVTKQLKYAKVLHTLDEKLTPEKYDFLIRINYAFLVLVPFYGINHAAFRIFKYLLIVDYCFIAENAFNGRLIRFTNLIILLGIVFLSLAAQTTVDGSIGDIFTLFERIDLGQLRTLF